MAKIKAGKKIKSVIGTFARQKTKRVEAVADALTDIVATRQAGKAAVAQAKAAGGGYIGRQQAIGQIGTGFIDTAGKIGSAAATGGLSSLGGAFGNIGSGLFDTGTGQMTQSPPPKKPFYEEPVFLLAAAAGLFLLLQRKK